MQELCKVLIVDDCEEDCAVYQRYLLGVSQAHQYDIRVTVSAEEALALCEQESFDVILLDYDLPELSGLEFLNWPKSPVLAGAAVIMLSAYGDEALAVKALKHGAQDYLVKQSLTADGLANSIRVALNQVRLKQKLQQSQERQQLIARIALKIRDTLDLAKILQTSVLEIRQLLKCDRVLILQQSEDHDSQAVVAEAISPQAPSSSSLLNPVKGAASYQSLLDPGQALSFEVENIATANLSSSCRKQLASFGVVSVLELPISLEALSSSTPPLWGSLVLHECQHPRTWSLAEQEMLQELCVHLAIAIQQSELLTQTQCALLKEKELNQFKSKIVATVSHEYRTPITSILASSATLERHFSKLDVEQSHRLLNLISQQARHLRELVDDMLVVNQVELGQIQFKPFPLNLEQFFKRLIEQYQVMAQENHEILLNFEGDCESFQGDFGLCRQIFGNLLSNSIKYSPDGGPIHLRVHCTDQDVKVTVWDQGIGIPAADLPSLCQSFTRGSNVDTITGTGLGLSIAKACVELHQGHLSLMSQEGKYTEVQVTLPLQPLMPEPLTPDPPNSGSSRE